MKKQMIVLTVLSAMLCLSGCGADPAQSGTVSSSEAAVTTADAAETTAAPDEAEETTAAPETEAQDTTAEADTEPADTTAESTEAAESAEAQTTAGETAAANQYGYYEENDLPENGLSVGVLEGKWTYAQSELTFKDCGRYRGSFTMTHEDSTESGYVQLEYSLTPDNKREYWYNLYHDDGTFVIGFSVSGDIPLDDLYSGQDGAKHYTRVQNET